MNEYIESCGTMLRIFLNGIVGTSVLKGFVVPKSIGGRMLRIMSTKT